MMKHLTSQESTSVSGGFVNVTDVTGAFVHGGTGRLVALMGDELFQHSDLIGQFVLGGLANVSGTITSSLTKDALTYALSDEA